MIWSNICLKYFIKIKYYLLVFKKIFTFKNGLIALEKYLLNFYKEFSEKNLKEISLEGLYNMQLNFVNNLSYLWFITIDNDFLIMIFSKNNSLQEINWLYSTKQIIYLKKLANNLISLDDYIDVYWHRFWDELKLENDEYDYNCDEFQIILKKYKNLDIKHSKTSNNTLLNFLLNNREKFRIYRSKNFSVARKIFLEIGNRFVEKKIIEKKENIFDFSIEQIWDLISGESKILQKNSIKNLIWNEFEWKIYIMDKFHIPKVDYDIILANNFDPWWTIFLWWLKWIIIENWNLLSHISIISRELKLPLLLWAKWLISVLKNGDYIKVLKDWDVYKKIWEKYEKIW